LTVDYAAVYQIRERARAERRKVMPFIYSEFWQPALGIFESSERVIQFDGGSSFVWCSTGQEQRSQFGSTPRTSHAITLEIVMNRHSYRCQSAPILINGLGGNAGREQTLAVPVEFEPAESVRLNVVNLSDLPTSMAVSLIGVKVLPR